MLYEVITGVVLQKYPMAATCGRVCVRFCEIACRRTQVDEAVGIKVLKRFVADHERGVSSEWFSSYTPPERKSPNLKVAVIGTGPAGISAAYHLLLKGRITSYNVCYTKLLRLWKRGPKDLFREKVRKNTVSVPPIHLPLP